jgi:hypothetical protein
MARVPICCSAILGQITPGRSRMPIMTIGKNWHGTAGVKEMAMWPGAGFASKE